uniref:Uncharacterized protein n=1 Tax=Spongospora subterranea TaxID=70186 RepID=A0A0H5R6S8_9EUKA|eukprot:CRZ09825.1 hypothetical protein [Spongospora subterranea]
MASEICVQGLERIIRACGWRQGAIRQAAMTAHAKALDCNSNMLTKAMFTGLVAACSSKSNSLIEISLDVMCELLAKDAVISVRQIGLDTPTDLVTVDEILQVTHPAIIDGNSQVKTHGLKVVLMASTSQTRRMHFDSIVLCVKTCIDVYARTDSSASQTAASATLTQILTTMLNRYDSGSTVSAINSAVTYEDVVFSVVNGLVEAVAFDLGDQSASDLGKEVARSLDTLLRLSMKRSATEGPDRRVQTFSREMILLMLQNAGPKFKSNPAIIEQFNEYLVGPFIANCMSGAVPDFRTGITILGTITLHFSRPLSSSLSLAINHLMNIVIEGNLRQDALVLVLLELLSFLAGKSNILGDLFVPRHSQASAPKLFVSILRMLQASITVAIERSSSSAIKAHPIIVQAVRTLGLIAGSLRHWINSLYVDGCETVIPLNEDTSPLIPSPTNSGDTPTVKRHTSIDLPTAKQGIINLLNQGWPPALAALSVATEHCSNDPETWRRCIDSYKEFIHLSMAMGAPVPRQTFIQALVNSTKLFTVRAIAQNVAGHPPPTIALNAAHQYVVAIAMNLALYRGDELEESWDTVLHFLWNLERFCSRTDNGLKEQVQQVYTCSAQLGPKSSVMHYTMAMCHISVQELQFGETAMLDRLANVMILNLHRDISSVEQVWALIRLHFSQSCNKGSAVVSLAVVSAVGSVLDAVFSRHAPLSVQRLQGEFVDVFVSIMGARHDPNLWHRVIICLSELVSIHHASIISAWHDILVVMTFASKEKSMSTLQLILKTTYQICRSRLHALQLAELNELITVIDVLSHNEANFIRLHSVALMCLFMKEACTSETLSPLIPSLLSTLLTLLGSVLVLSRPVIDSLREAISGLATTQPSVWSRLQDGAFQPYLEIYALQSDPDQFNVQMLEVEFATLHRNLIQVVTETFFCLLPASLDSLGLLLEMLLQSSQQGSTSGALAIKSSSSIVRFFSLSSPDDLSRVLKCCAELFNALKDKLSLASTADSAMTALKEIVIGQYLSAPLQDILPLVDAIHKMSVVARKHELLQLEAVAIQSLMHLAVSQNVKYPSMTIDIIIRAFDLVAQDSSEQTSDASSSRDASFCLVLSTITSIGSENFWEAFCADSQRPHCLLSKIQSESEAVRECIRQLLSDRAISNNANNGLENQTAISVK